MGPRLPALLVVFVVLHVCPAAAQPVGDCIFAAEQWGRANLTPKESTESVPGETDLQVMRVLKDYEKGVRELSQFRFEAIPSDLDNRFRKVAAAIGRVDLLLKYGSRTCISVCTGWLITDDMFVTSHHCTGYPNASIERVRILMGYDNRGALGQSYDVDVKPVESSHGLGKDDLDFAIFKVSSGTPGKDYGTLKPFTGELRKGHALAVVGHPWAILKQLVRGNCAAADLHPRDANEVRHTCDTAKGMSGAPILDEESTRVVGIHRRGERVGPDNFNYGVVLNEIVAVSKVLNLPSTRPTGPANFDAAIAEVMVGLEARPTLTFPITIATAGINPDMKDLVVSIDEMNHVLNPQDGPQCPVRVVLDGEPTPLAPHQTPDVIATHADFDNLKRLPGTIKLMKAVTWCGPPTRELISCSEVGGRTVAISYEASRPHLHSSMLHGLGHSAGLPPHKDPANFMYSSSKLATPKVEPKQCAALYLMARRTNEAAANK